MRSQPTYKYRRARHVSIALRAIQLIAALFVVGATSIDPIAAQGEISITGTPGPDTILLGKDGAGNYWSSRNGVVTNHGLGHTNAIVTGLGNGDTIDARGFAQAPNPLDIRLIARGNGGTDTILGGDAGDIIYGDNEDDILLGYRGEDHIEGGHHNDSLQGGGGEDHLYGQEEDDRIRGNDLLTLDVDVRDFIEGGFRKDTIWGGDGDDWIWGDVRGAAGGSGDNIFGEDGLDTIYGGAGDDYIEGNLDNDEALGEIGCDIVHGGDDPDTVFGNEGPDFVFGNGAVDGLVSGGTEDDTCVGGGADGDTVTGGDGRDTCAECPPDACAPFPSCDVFAGAIANMGARDPVHAAYDPALMRLDLEADFIDWLTDSQSYVQELDGSNRCLDPLLGADLVLGDTWLIGQDVDGVFHFTDVWMQVLTPQGAPILSATLTAVSLDPASAAFTADVTGLLVHDSQGSRFVALLQAAVAEGHPVSCHVMNACTVNELLSTTSNFTTAGQATGPFDLSFPTSGSLGGRPVEICTNGIDENADGCFDCDDFDCAGHPLCVESICNDLVDDDNDGETDCQDSDCRLNAACRELACANGADDDNDGPQDCFDPDCSMAANCREDCTNGIDDNGDGQIDCHDPVCEGFHDACREAANCADGLDNDLDGQIDCDSKECTFAPGPSAVPDLTVTRISAAGTRLDWLPPVTGGSLMSMRYDVLRATSATGFLSAACVEINNGPDLKASEVLNPPAHGVFYFLVRAETACGAGDVGTTSNGTPRSVRSCQLHTDGTPCDDGLFCSVGEVWTADRCGNAASRSCDEPNPATFDYCDESLDACFHHPL